VLGFYCDWGMLRGVLRRGSISTAMDGVEVLVLAREETAVCLGIQSVVAYSRSGFVVLYRDENDDLHRSCRRRLLVYLTFATGYCHAVDVLAWLVVSGVAVLRLPALT